MASALAGGVLAELTSARLTYFATVPFVALAVVAFLRFDEPRLHRTDEPVSLRSHVRLTFCPMTGRPEVRRVILLAALVALLSQAVFEFGPLWLVALDAPARCSAPTGRPSRDPRRRRLAGAEARPGPAPPRRGGHLAPPRPFPLADRSSSPWSAPRPPSPCCSP